MSISVNALTCSCSPLLPRQRDLEELVGGDLMGSASAAVAPTSISTQLTSPVNVFRISSSEGDEPTGLECGSVTADMHLENACTHDQ